MNKSIIIDASVCAKWLLPDEKDLAAGLIKKEFAKRAISISVPVLIFYEVNNLLKSAILSGRLSKTEASNLYEAFLGLDFIVYSSKQLFNTALKEAVDLNISSYDASYVCLAKYLQVPFYSADEKLVKKASDKLVRFVEDY